MSTICPGFSFNASTTAFGSLMAVEFPHLATAILVTV
jgi:hypothetical protein